MRPVGRRALDGAGDVTAGIRRFMTDRKGVVLSFGACIGRSMELRHDPARYQTFLGKAPMKGSIDFVVAG